jgi:cystathionine beta-lyase family protein involved in aluminum resistance
VGVWAMAVFTATNAVNIILFIVFTVTDSLKAPIHPIIVSDISSQCKDVFFDIDQRTKIQLSRVLECFKMNCVDESAFHGVNGYGHGDIGREKFDSIIAELMGSEAAFVRLQLFSGTHAISSALFGALRPGDEMVCVSGQPYDTLEEVVGIRGGKGSGSLADWNIKYSQIEMAPDEKSFDLESLRQILDNKERKVKLIHIQRSCGYQWRPSIDIDEIERLCVFVKKTLKRSDVTIFVDNCYGELVEDREPCHVGVDLVAGSLIKNLGGTIAPAGGYIAGTKELVERAACHLSAPGVEGGATFRQYKDLFQGLFLAPVIVGESLKGAELTARIFSELGFECNPAPGAKRTDIIQAIRLENRENLIKFCEVVQRMSPVNAFVKPIPGHTSGYGDEVIFADGTFIEGSTLELSADGPLREPFVAYTQGCTHWSHWELVLEAYLQEIGM